jgi:gephyrin
VKPGRYRVLTPSTHPPSSLVPAGSVYRINTGAPLPPGTDTAVMVEDTEVVETYDDEHLGKEEAVIRILADIPVNDNIREPGSDVRSGDRVLSKGALLGFGGGEIGTLSFVGRTEVKT